MASTGSEGSEANRGLYNSGVSRDRSISDFAWESIFQMYVDVHFATSKFGSSNISKSLVRYGIQLDLASIILDLASIRIS